MIEKGTRNLTHTQTQRNSQTVLIAWLERVFFFFLNIVGGCKVHTN